MLARVRGTSSLGPSPGPLVRFAFLCRTSFLARSATSWKTRFTLNGTPGRTFASSLRVRSAALYTLSYGSMKWCPRQDSHPHWTASEAVVSALDYMGVKWQPRMDLHHQPCASKAHALRVELRGCDLTWSVRLDLHQHLPGYEPDALAVKLQTNEMALPRGFAPRASAFARQCAALLHLGSLNWTRAPD